MSGQNSQKRRATRPELKMQRREDILAATQALFAEFAFDTIAMLQVAQRAGIAKGTLYLYFPTKEALFLALTERLIHGWFDDLDSALKRGDVDSAARLVQVVQAALQGRPELPRLLGILHSVLERNIDLEVAIAFKRGLRGRALKTGARLESALDFIRPGEGIALLLHIDALVIGTHSLAHPAPVVAQAMQRPDLALFRIDFASELKTQLGLLLAGMQMRRQINE